MAKFAEIQSKQVIELPGFEGRVWLRDLPMGKIQPSFNKLADLASENEAEAILFAFQNFFCDSEGNPFEDINTVEDLDQVGMVTLQEMLDGIKPGYLPNKDHLGK